MVLLDFFGHLRAQRLSVSVREFLTLLDALRCGLAAPDIEQFYYLARCALIKDESLYDRYDQAFTAFYNQHLANAAQATEIPSDWLRTALARRFTAEEQATLRAYGWDELMKKLEQRLHEQTSRHAGGHKWIGTGGASPFGNSGYHPEGIRIGGQSAGHRPRSRCGTCVTFAITTDNADWRLIIVGDATMSPYELLRPGGSVEHDNPETGATWVARLLKAWPSAAWLNPEPIAAWQYRPSIALLRNLMSARMYGVTPAGLVQAMNQLSK